MSIKKIRNLTVNALPLAVLFLTPAVAFGQGLDNINDLVEALSSIVDMLIPIAFALILLVFFWGLAKYVLNADNEDARDQGKRIMIGGVIALAVASLIWGIVAFIGEALDIEETDNQNAPGVNNL